MTDQDKNGVLPVNYQKSHHFRVVWAEGCFGGLSPRGLIRSAFYNERGALPDDAQINLEDGHPVSETITKVREGLVREVEVELVMDLATAIAYYHWLGEKLEALRQGMGVQDAEWQLMNTQAIKSTR